MAGLDPRYEVHQNWFDPIKYKSVLTAIGPIGYESVKHEKYWSALSESLSFVQSTGKRISSHDLSRVCHCQIYSLAGQENMYP
jgi:hypothetical protein